jgi:aminocarboxymuconate-semialdehyde decarboxylase
MTDIVDIHAHYVSPELIAEAGRNGRHYHVRLEQGADGQRLVLGDGVALRPFFPELCELPLRLPRLEAMGIKRQLISTWTDMAGDMLPPREGARWSRLQNDTLADAARRYPGTFEAMATLPMQDVTLAVEELRRAVRGLGVRAVEIGTNVNGRDLDGAAFLPLWRAIHDLDVFVLLHPPFAPVGDARIADYFLNNLVAYPMDTTIAATRMMFSGLLSELPGLKCCLAHAGGFLPYQIGRLQRGFRANPMCRTFLKESPERLLYAFYYDTLTHDDAALEFLLKQVGGERMLYGSDYPFEMFDVEGPQRVERIPGAAPATIRAILAENAESALSLAGTGAASRVSA